VSVQVIAEVEPGGGAKFEPTAQSETVTVTGWGEEIVSRVFHANLVNSLRQ